MDEKIIIDQEIKYLKQCPRCFKNDMAITIVHFGMCSNCCSNNHVYKAYINSENKYKYFPESSITPIPTPKEVNNFMGWECPRCHKVNAPSIESCNCPIPIL